MTPSSPVFRVASTTASAAVLAITVGLFPGGPAAADSPEPTPASTTSPEQCLLVCWSGPANDPEPAGPTRTGKPKNPESPPAPPADPVPAPPEQPAPSDTVLPEPIRHRPPRRPNRKAPPRVRPLRPLPQDLPVPRRPPAPQADRTGTPPSPGPPRPAGWQPSPPAAIRVPAVRPSCPSSPASCCWAPRVLPSSGGAGTGSAPGPTDLPDYLPTSQLRPEHRHRVSGKIGL
jgi:hypothetical protein